MKDKDKNGSVKSNKSLKYFEEWTTWSDDNNKPKDGPNIFLIIAVMASMIIFGIYTLFHMDKQSKITYKDSAWNKFNENTNQSDFDKLNINLHKNELSLLKEDIEKLKNEKLILELEMEKKEKLLRNSESFKKELKNNDISNSYESGRIDGYSQGFDDGKRRYKGSGFTGGFIFGHFLK
jgi:hypothetical protein